MLHNPNLASGRGAIANFHIKRDRTTLHEMGHCMFMPHQWTDKVAATGAVSGGVPAEHDYKDYCIMSYQKNVLNFYDYCGRCNLKLRGWDTSPIAKNNV